MKATLSFDLETELDTYNRAIRADDLASALDEFRSWLRNRRKHGTLSKEVAAWADLAWEALHVEINNFGVEDLLQ